MSEGTYIASGDEALDELYPRAKAIGLNALRAFYDDGEVVAGYAPADGPSMIWIGGLPWRCAGYKYWETDLRSPVDCLLRHQLADGSFPDYVQGAAPGIACVKVGCEAFAETAMVEMAHAVWQAVGDDEWIASALPALESGLQYLMTNRHRWSPEHELIKRPFTIDTWDFQYPDDPNASRPWFDITDGSKFCIMHGDNSRLHLAAKLLAKLHRYLGDVEAAARWARTAEAVRGALNRVCWNGTFYAHQVHLDPVNVPGVDEAAQLSLSNTFDMNRGVASHDQAVSIINEYQRRRQTVESFAEWFSIDPPFPDGAFAGTWAEKAGEYVNGGVWPLVGGQLARASFEHGFETYGVDILRRYADMITETGESHFWYHRDGRPGRSSSATIGADTMGIGAMLYALFEGLAGVEDHSKLFGHVRLCPRWAATQMRTVEVRVECPASSAYFKYVYVRDDEQNKLSIVPEGQAGQMDCHVLLPGNARARRVLQSGKPLEFENTVIQRSHYVDFRCAGIKGEVEVTW